VTEYYEASVQTRGYTYTYIYDIASPTGTALPIPIATSSIISTDYDGGAATVVRVLYPSLPAYATRSSEAATATATNAVEITSYFVNAVFTAPTSCSSSWAYTTAIAVDPPYYIAADLTPTSVSTSWITDNSQPFQPTTIGEAIAFIDPTQLPEASLSSITAYYGPTPACYYPGNGNYGGYSGSSSGSFCSQNPYSASCNGDNSEDNWLYDSYWYGISPLAIILISVLGWTFVLVIIGLFESYFHFNRLMKGWQARRGLPITWWFWIFPFTCFIGLCVSRRGFQARSAEEAQELENKWREMGFWRRMGLWLRHGFTWGYPAILGPAPPRVGRPSRSVPVQPLLQVSPPSTAGGSSRQPTPQTSTADVERAPAAGQEMSQVQPPSPTLPESSPHREITTVPEEDTITPASPRHPSSS
jgi:hypothetical protein